MKLKELKEHIDRLYEGNPHANVAFATIDDSIHEGCIEHLLVGINKEEIIEAPALSMMTLVFKVEATEDNADGLRLLADALNDEVYHD